jgi:hypothetical protein
MLPVTRRLFALSLLLAPMACLGCGGEGVVVVDTKAGERRRKKLEDLKEKAHRKRDSPKEKANLKRNSPKEEKSP